MATPTRTIPIVPVSSGPVSGKIQMRATSGVFTRWRWAIVWLTQALYYGLPWLNGKVLPVDPSSYYGTLSDVSAGSATSANSVSPAATPLNISTRSGSVVGAIWTGTMLSRLPPVIITGVECLRSSVQNRRCTLLLSPMLNNETMVS